MGVGGLLCGAELLAGGSVGRASRVAGGGGQVRGGARASPAVEVFAIAVGGDNLHDLDVAPQGSADRVAVGVLQGP